MVYLIIWYCLHITVDLSILSSGATILFNGANVVVIYNFFLLTLDTNINQFIKVYHIFYKIQYQMN